MSDEPRAATSEELADNLIDYAKGIARYWASVDNGSSTQERIEGAIFSFLEGLDGCSPALPAFDLVALVHESDKEFNIDNGENWIEAGTVVSTMLHEMWYE